MFKKLASLLFEEEEVIDEKPEEEKVDLRRVKRHAEVIEEPVKAPVFEQEPIEKPKRSSFETILADDGRSLHGEPPLSDDVRRRFTLRRRGGRH